MIGALRSTGSDVLTIGLVDITGPGSSRSATPHR
jgi:hypothetical protein